MSKTKTKTTKKQVLVTIPAELSVKVKILAAILDTSVSSLTEEAYKLLIEKYSELLEKKGVKLDVGQE